MKKINKIINIIKNDNGKIKDKCTYNKDILYRKEKGKWKIYIPQSIKHQLITELHNTYGHGGIQRTIKLFKGVLQWIN